MEFCTVYTLDVLRLEGLVIRMCTMRNYTEKKPNAHVILKRYKICYLSESKYNDQLILPRLIDIVTICDIQD